MNPYGFEVKHVSQQRRPIIFAIDSNSATDKTDNTYEFPCGTIRDVVGLELVKAVVPNVDNDHYLVLKVDDMDNTLGTNSTNQDAFCTLERSSAASSPIVYIKNTDQHNMPYTYCMPEPRKLSKMRVRFFRPDGSAPDLTTNYVLVFEIHTLNQPALPMW